MQSPDLSFVVPSISHDMRGLFEAHFAFVWRYMAQRGVPYTSLDDLAHSVFRIVREHPSRRDPSRPRSVIVCMISRQVLREYKKRNGTAAATDPQLDGDGDGPTRTFSRDAATGMLDAALDSLTEMQREVFLLCAGEQMTAREVGDALGVAESTVEIRVKSAHQRVGAFIERLRAHPLWGSMSDLSPRGLLDAAQSARTPSDRDRERVFAAMLAYSMTSTPVKVELPSLPHHLPTQPRLPSPPKLPQASGVRDPSTLPPTRRSSRTHLGLALATFAAVTFGTASFFVTLPLHPAPAATANAEESVEVETTTSAAEPAVPETENTAQDVAEPDAAPTADDEAHDEPAERSTPRAAKRHRRNQRRSVPPPAPRADDRGARQLFAAERALRAGEPRAALELVREHAAKFPDSNLATERNALRAQILCDLGRTKAARRVVLELEADHAEQPLLASVDEACMHPN